MTQATDRKSSTRPKLAKGVCSFCSKKGVVFASILNHTESCICVQCLYRASEVVSAVEPGTITCYSCKNTRSFSVHYGNGSVAYLEKGAYADGQVIYYLKGTKGTWLSQSKPTLFQCGNQKCKKSVPFWMFTRNKHVRSALPGACKY